MRPHDPTPAEAPTPADDPTPAEDSPRPPDRRRQRLGALGEQLALEHFQRLGFVLVERNYRTRWGELDLVLCDGRTLVFAEVKTARGHAGVAPFERLHAAKQLRVRQIARTWLHERSERPRCAELRFDAVGVIVDRCGRLLTLDHLEGAF
jgi:putative endonuclease